MYYVLDNVLFPEERKSIKTISDAILFMYILIFVIYTFTSTISIDIKTATLD